MNSVIDTLDPNTTDAIDNTHEPNTNTDIINAPDVKKKRGRKKKEDTNPVVEPDRIPKKRGRKPKGGKLINNPIHNNNDGMTISNVILHLKCSLDDLTDVEHNDTHIIHDPAKYIPNPPPNIMAYSSTDKHSFSQFGTMNNDGLQESAYNVNMNNTDGVEHTCVKCKTIINDVNEPETVTDDSNMKDINMKLKQIKLQLYQNSNPDKKSACFWCTYEYDNQPCYIPKHEYNGELSGYGSFCRPECAVAYLLKENIDDSIKFERYHFLNKVYSKIYNFKKNIKPAPDPHYLLDKFYGNLNIQEYRKLMKSEHMLLVIEKPMTRILPELHENTDDMENTGIHGSKCTLSKQSGVYKVKRESEKQKGPTKNEIMKENFGF
tara:strand:+ start:47 stop:1177 length:1131 start_codon:yes stop_codon:yes gene_type:complete